MKKIIVVLLLVATNYSVFAQECTSTVSGEVIDFHDKTPLESAIVYIENVGEYVTDKQGRFVASNLCDGNYMFIVSHIECDPKTLRVKVEGNTFKRITLEHHVEELHEVTLIGRAEKKTSSAQEASLSGAVIEKYGAATLGDALKEIPGVTSLNTGANIVKPTIQGLTGSRVLILNHGVRMQDMEWGDEHAPNIDINSAGEVTVVKGAAALKYGGDAIGGTIIIEPAKILRKDSLFGSTSLVGMTNGRGGSLSTSLTKSYKNGWFIAGQASYKRFGDNQAPDYVLSNTGLEQLGASLSIGKKGFFSGWDIDYSYFDSSIGVLAASHIGNVDDLIRAINSDRPLIIRDFTYDIGVPRQEVTHHLVRGNYYKRFENWGKLNFQYDYQSNQRFEFDVRVGDDRDKPAIDLLLQTHTVAADFAFDTQENYKIEVGAMYRFQDNFANPETGVRRLIPDYVKNDAGLFLTGKYFKDNWIFDAGVRYDFNKVDAQKFYRTSRWEERGYDVDFADLVIDDRGSQLLTNPVFDYHNLSGTTGFQYNFNDGKELRFNYSLAQRAPNPAELFSDGLHHSAARIELGDLRIGQETSHKVSLSLEQSSENLGWAISPYLNSITDFILLEPTGVEFTIRGAFPVWEYRQTDARLLGVDASAYFNWSKNWRTDHHFSLVKGTDISQDIALINMPAPRFRNKLSFVKKEWHNFNASLESIFVTEQNEHPDDIIVFSPEQQTDVLLEINTPPGAYHVLNLDTGMDFSIHNKADLSVGFAINNLLNTNYRDYLNRQRYFADELGRNFQLRIKYNY
ncbi:TonB-dependent receptor [Sungkyunkwania multivorans]|uniref:TonB-dependent receptor n=1 Tax=Sungkyunkwania multivorans TaxID=1173618 RepID=A0ABW3D219_9FLAO